MDAKEKQILKLKFRKAAAKRRETKEREIILEKHYKNYLKRIPYPLQVFRAMQEFAEYYHQERIKAYASQQMPSEELWSSTKPISDLEYCVQCFIRSEHLTRKWDKFRDEWFAQRKEQSLQQENQTED